MRMCTEHRAGPFPWPQMQMLVNEQKQLPSSGPKASLTKDPQPCRLQSALSSGVPEASRDTDIQRGLPGPEWLGCCVRWAFLEGIFHSHVHRCGFLCGENFDLSRTNWNVMYYPLQPRAASTWAGIPQDTTGVLWKQGSEGTLGRQWVGLSQLYFWESLIYEAMSWTS